MTTPGRALTVAGCIALYLGSLPSDAFMAPSLPPTGRVPPSLVSRRTSATTASPAAPRPGIRKAHLNSQESSSLLRERDHAPKTTTTRPAVAGAVMAGRRGIRVGSLRSSSSSSGDDNDKEESWTSEDSVAAAAAASDSSSSSSSPAAANFAKGAWASGDGSGGGGSDGAEPPAGGGEMKEIGNPETRDALKRKLFQKVATLNRGFVAQESDRLDVEELIEMLELENPNPKPCVAFETASSPIAGRWQLLYTTSLDVLSLQVNPTVTVGQIFQQIEADGRGIQNIIELQPPFAAVANRVLGSSVVTLTVKLETTPVSDSRINLKFVRTELKADSFLGKKLELPSVGVDLLSVDKLKEAFSRRKMKIQDAKKKAQGLAKKTKQGDATDGSDGSGSSSRGNEHDGERIPEGTEAADSDTSGGGGGGDSSPSSASSDLRTPYFETTYVDGDMRIGRTGQGDVFISTRA